jgi:Na+-driven multidrug efflux pump
MLPLIVLIISMWLVRYPFAALLEPVMGADAIWWSFPVGSLVSLAITTVYYRRGTWKKAHMLPATSPVVAEVEPVA